MMRSALTPAILAGVAVVGLGACSNLSNMMSGGSAQHSAAATAPTVAPDMVRQVQSKLRDSGYYKQGSVDGVWGSGTESAVRSFQNDHALTASGQLDVPTLQALNVAGTAPAAMNSSTTTNTTVGTPATTTVTPTQPVTTDSTGTSASSQPNGPTH